MIDDDDEMVCTSGLPASSLMLFSFLQNNFIFWKLEINCHCQGGWVGLLLLSFCFSLMVNFHRGILQINQSINCFWLALLAI
jgi:hypothetical protein